MNRFHKLLFLSLWGMSNFYLTKGCFFYRTRTRQLLYYLLLLL